MELQHAIAIVTEAFPNLTEEQAGSLLRNKTGWPIYWGRSDGSTAEECLRTQLRRLKERVTEQISFDDGPAMLLMPRRLSDDELIELEEWFLLIVKKHKRWNAKYRDAP